MTALMMVVVVLLETEDKQGMEYELCLRATGMQFYLTVNSQTE
jgi:hypothetical protein